MADSIGSGEAYLREIAGSLRGPRRARRRLLIELRGHLEDAVAAELDAGAGLVEAERRAIEHLGPSADLARAWVLRCSRLRARQGSRAGVLAAAAAASVLAMTQHADGRRDPAVPPGSCATARDAADTPSNPARPDRTLPDLRACGNVR